MPLMTLMADDAESPLSPTVPVLVGESPHHAQVDFRAEEKEELFQIRLPLNTNCASVTLYETHRRHLIKQRYSGRIPPFSRCPSLYVFVHVVVDSSWG